MLDDWARNISESAYPELWPTHGWVSMLGPTGNQLLDYLGACCNAPITSHASSNWQASRFGSAYSFDGSADYAELEKTPFVDADQQGTIVILAKTPNTSGTQNTLFGLGGDSTLNAGLIRFTLRNDAGTQRLDIVQRTDGEVTANVVRANAISISDEIHSYAVTSMRDSYNLFIDGVPQTISTASGSNNGDWFADTTVTGTRTYTIGCVKFNGSYIQQFEGQIYAAYLYPFALTPPELQLLAERPLLPLERRQVGAVSIPIAPPVASRRIMLPLLGVG